MIVLVQQGERPWETDTRTVFARAAKLSRRPNVGPATTAENSPSQGSFELSRAMGGGARAFVRPSRSSRRQQNQRVPARTLRHKGHFTERLAGLWRLRLERRQSSTATTRRPCLRAMRVVTLGTSTRHRLSATTDSSRSRASTTTLRCAPSRPSSSPGSPPAGARESSTNSETKTAKRSPRPKAKPPAPTASRSTPKSGALVGATPPPSSSRTRWWVLAERSRPKRSLRPPTRQEKKLPKMWPEGLDCR